MAGFVHLHVHSHLSFMDGAVSLDALIERATHLGMRSLALTDHQGLYGVVRFYRAALATGIKPVIGAEIVVEAAGIDSEEGDRPPHERLTLPAPVGFRVTCRRGCRAAPALYRSQPSANSGAMAYVRMR